MTARLLAAIFGALLLLLPSIGPSAAEPPLVRHDAELSLDADGGGVTLRDRISVSGRDSLRLRFADWLRLDDLRLDGGKALDGPKIDLPDRGEHVVEVKLSGRLPEPVVPSEGEAPSFAVYGGLLPDVGALRIHYRLAVTVPAPLRAIATGGLVEETLDADEARAVFVADYPAEPPALFVGPYEVRERRAGDLRLRTWFHPELAGLSEVYLEQSLAYIRRYSEAIGPYPFADFHVVSAPVGVGLGFPGLTYVGRQVLPLPFMRGRSLAHEVLHNWWGNGVAAEFASGNWVEGLTTYMADYALAEDKGAEAAREMRLGWLRDFAALPPERDQPVTAFVTKQHQAGQVVGYNKVAFIFHMLRGEIGEVAFRAGLRALWRDHLHASASWADLRRAFETASGRDLAVFFDQWLTRRGAPRIALETASAGPAESGFGLGLVLKQAAPAYAMRVPVLIETEAGPKRLAVTLSEATATGFFELQDRPLTVHVDPDHQVFRRLLPGESPPILRDVTLSQEAKVVVATSDAEAGEVARALAGRLLDDPREVAVATAGDGPLLIVGTTAEVMAALAEGGWDPVPETLAGRGTARAWTLTREGAAPAVAVAADDAVSLQALLRPLPHYGGKSWLVFEGRRAVETGVWRVEDSPLSRDLR